MYEVEEKYRVLDVRRFRRSVREFGLRAGKTKQQTDTYYSWPGARRLGRPHLLRVRQEMRSKRTSWVLEYSRSRGRSTAREYQVSINDPAALRAMLKAMGFRREVVVRKHRQEWHARGVEVELDRVHGAGWFVELEVKSRQVAGARRRIRELAERLALRQSARSERLRYYNLVPRR